MSGIICARCGEPVEDGFRFCMNCGAPVGDVEADTSPLPSDQGHPQYRLVVVRGEGGQTASYALGGTEHLAGRDEGIILFPDDVTISPRHATFFYQEDRLYVRDESSANGTYLRVTTPVQLRDDDRIICGEQLLVFNNGETIEPEPDSDGTYFFGTPLSSWYFKLTQVLNGGKPGAVHCARKARVVVGREKADFNFPDDRFMSHNHSTIEMRDSVAWLSDTGSRNGTFLQLRPGQDVPLAEGDYVFLGRQLLKVTL